MTPSNGAAPDGERISVVTFDALGLGDRTYLIHDAHVAIVVDPQRDPSPYLECVGELGLVLSHVLETHIHNDYVSGGLELARLAHATYVIPPGEVVEFEDECVRMSDGEVIVAGSLQVQAIDTPGHTAHHLTYLVEPTDGSDGVGVICSGGSLLAGGAGRTDLLGDEHTRPLAHAQWRSVNRLLETLDERTVVLPTHGFGSFCAATPIAGGDPDELTIGHERTRNSATRLEADDYVENMIANLPPIPRYYRHMAPLNRAGGRPFELGTLKRVPLDSLEREIVGAGFVIDVRPRRVFARQHRRGAWNLELGPNLATYLGWVVPYFAPFTLIAEGEDDIDRARAALARIGRETVAAWASSEELERNGPGVGSYPVATFADLGVITRNSGSPEIIDVRHPAEWRAGHLRDARHVPLPELTNVRATLPDDQPIWVHCAAGFRAAVASSMLASAGRSPVLVDDVFEHAALAGLEIESGDVSVPGAIPDRVRP